MRLVPFLVALAAAAPAPAAGFQNLDALEARLVNALGAGVGEAGGPAAPIDRRMKLAQCPATVQMDPPALGAVALRCPAAGWRIRVPLARLGGAPSAAGFAAPREAATVRRGDPVELVAEQDGFSVSVGAVAQEDGAAGARIRVRSDGDDRRPQGQLLFAEVVGPGRVRLPGF